MSIRSSLFLTSDSEHCFTDCSKPHFDGEQNWLGDEMTVEINLDNLISISPGEDDVTLILKPGTEIYEQFCLMDFDNSKPKKMLELARSEIESCYKRLGIENSDILREIDVILNQSYK